MQDVPLIELDREAPPVPDERLPEFRGTWFACLLVLVSVLVLVSGAGPAPSYEPRWTAEDVYRDVGADTQRVYAVVEAAANTTRVKAYRRATGALDWSLDVPTGAALLASVRDGVVLLSARDTIAVDAATGAERWRAPQSRFLGFSGGLVVYTDLDGMAGRDLRTGQEHWRTDVDLRSLVLTGGERSTVDRVLAWDDDGTVRMFDPATGALRSQAHVEQPRDLNRGSAYLVGDLLVIGESLLDGDRWYDTQTGRLTRTRSRGHTALVFMDRCGPYLCRGDNTGLTAYDLYSGGVVWHADGVGIVRLLDPHRALAYSLGDGGDGLVGRLIDPRTGRTLDALSGWRPTGDVTGAQVTLWRRSDNGVLLALHNAYTGATAVVGELDGWYMQPACALVDGRLACAGQRRLAVWGPTAYS
jgi:outer membrane protein assembly factor BamB